MVTVSRATRLPDPGGLDGRTTSRRFRKVYALSAAAVLQTAVTLEKSALSEADIVAKLEGVLGGGRGRPAARATRSPS